MSYVYLTIISLTKQAAPHKVIYPMSTLVVLCSLQCQSSPTYAHEMGSNVIENLILICTSLWIDCLFEIRKLQFFPLAFVAGSLQGHWWGFVSWNYVVRPIFFLMNVFIALKGTHFLFLFYSLLVGMSVIGKLGIPTMSWSLYTTD